MYKTFLEVYFRKSNIPIINKVHWLMLIINDNEAV